MAYIFNEITIEKQTNLMSIHDIFELCYSEQLVLF